MRRAPRRPAEQRPCPGRCSVGPGLGRGGVASMLCSRCPAVMANPAGSVATWCGSAVQQPGTSDTSVAAGSAVLSSLTISAGRSPSRTLRTRPAAAKSLSQPAASSGSASARAPSSASVSGPMVRSTSHSCSASPARQPGAVRCNSDSTCSMSAASKNSASDSRPSSSSSRPGSSVRDARRRSASGWSPSYMNAPAKPNMTWRANGDGDSVSTAATWTRLDRIWCSRPTSPGRSKTSLRHSRIVSSTMGKSG